MFGEVNGSEDFQKQTAIDSDKEPKKAFRSHFDGFKSGFLFQLPSEKVFLAGFGGRNTFLERDLEPAGSGFLNIFAYV